MCSSKCQHICHLDALFCPLLSSIHFWGVLCHGKSCHKLYFTATGKSSSSFIVEAFSFFSFIDCQPEILKRERERKDLKSKPTYNLGKEEESEALTRSSGMINESKHLETVEQQQQQHLSLQATTVYWPASRNACQRQQQQQSKNGGANGGGDVTSDQQKSSDSQSSLCSLDATFSATTISQF